MVGRIVGIPLFQLLLRVGITSADGRVCWAFVGVQMVFQMHSGLAGYTLRRSDGKARGVREQQYQRKQSS